MDFYRIIDNYFKLIVWGIVPKICPPNRRRLFSHLLLQEGVSFTSIKLPQKTSIKLRFTQWFYKTTTKKHQNCVLKTSVAAYVDVWAPPVGSICCHNPHLPTSHSTRVATALKSQLLTESLSSKNHLFSLQPTLCIHKSVMSLSDFSTFLFLTNPSKYLAQFIVKGAF